MVKDDGRISAKRFLLGTDRAVAELANRKLEQLWKEVEVDFRRRRERAALLPKVDWLKPIEAEPITGEIVQHPLNVLKIGPIWEPHMLAIADAIRKGRSDIYVLPSPPLPRGIVEPEKLSYLQRLMDLRDRYSVIAFTPSDPALYAEQLEGMTHRVERGLKITPVCSSRLRHFINDLSCSSS